MPKEGSLKVNIPEHVEHIDCPRCISSGMVRMVAVEGKSTNPRCGYCFGEGVVRADGKPMLKTKIRDYMQPQFRTGSL